MIRKCYLCNHDFEDYNRLNPDSNLVFCSFRCQQEKYGEDIELDGSERYEDDIELYNFNRRNNPND